MLLCWLREIRNNRMLAVSKPEEFARTPKRGFVMFQLFEMVLVAPIVAFIFAGLQDSLYAILIVADCDDCGFNDLGKLLFGGVILAIVVGVAVSIFWRRVRGNNSRASEFVSIRAIDRKQ
jgi:hypothetical protein